MLTRQMRFQALMPDILHWLGIKKIDRMLSMSNMKHDAIVQSGIKIYERIPIPEEMIPNDSRVEIDAKINAGYFTTGKNYTMEELAAVRGRGWEKWEDITVGCQSLMEMVLICPALNGYLYFGSPITQWIYVYYVPTQVSMHVDLYTLE